MKEENKTINSAEENHLKVNTIPGDFYAGANPVIKFRNVEKEISVGKTKATPSEAAALDKATVSGGGLATILTHPKFLAFTAIILFVLFVLVATIYYWWQGRRPLQNIPSTTQGVQVGTTTQSEVVSSSLETTDVAVSTTVTTTKIEIDNPQPPALLTSIPMEFASPLLGNSADMDSDDITDNGEEFFGTDSGNPDTDGDGYNDGHEVYNLYNPLGIEPMKLVESGNILDYSNPAYGYKMYYPKNWAQGTVDNEFRDILFSAMNGENIELRTFDIELGQTFADWFGQNAPDQKYVDLVEFKSVFGESGFMRKDFLVFYFIDQSKVYVLAYHAVDPVQINYRSVIKMMARSFRLTGNVVEQPAPIIESQMQTTTPEENFEVEVGTTTVNI